MSTEGKEVNIYVNALSTSCKQNGKSWDTPYTNLDKALIKARSIGRKVHILVAAGVYIPSVVYPNPPPGQVPDPRYATFLIPNNVSITGGFDPSNSKCDPGKNITILTGVNYYRNVVTVEEKSHVVISSLYIEGGRSDNFVPGTPTEDVVRRGTGSAVYVSAGSSAELHNLVVRRNTSLLGGSVSITGGNLTITNSIFRENIAGVEGGAIRAEVSGADEAPSRISISASRFDNNSAKDYGGAIAVKSQRFIRGNPESKAIINDCVFTGNSACGAGAVYINSVSADISASVFKDNIAATFAGALVCKNAIAAALAMRDAIPFVPSVVSISGSRFVNNTAVGRQPAHISSNPDDTFPSGGGAVASIIKGDLRIEGTSFTGNVAYGPIGNGGALINGGAYQGSLFGQPIKAIDASTSIRNSAFKSNSSLFGDGGAIYAYKSPGSVLTVKSTKFSGNTAPNGDGDNIAYGVV